MSLDDPPDIPSPNFGPWGLNGTHSCCHGRVLSDSRTSTDPEYFTDLRWSITGTWDASGRSYAWVFGSSHSGGGANFLLADGVVKFLSDSMNYRMFCLMNYIHDGVPVE